jgi:hypothetical protein
MNETSNKAADRMLDKSRQRWFAFSLRTLFVIVTIFGVWLAAVPLLSVAKWVGRKSLQVEVLVIDTEALLPVSGAEITIFEGPSSPIEGRMSGRQHSDFSPDPKSPATETRMSDSDGRCRFTYKFFAAGSEGVLDHTGYVDTSQVWLRISAAGRPSTLVPLDRQSIHPRDISDTSPLVVTVVLNKCHAD